MFGQKAHAADNIVLRPSKVIDVREGRGASALG